MKHVLKSVKRFMKEADMFLLSVCLLSSIFGLLLVTSSTMSYPGTMRYITIQGIGIVLGVFLFICFSLIDIYDLSDYWKWILAFNILFISSTALFGVEVSGRLECEFTEIRRVVKRSEKTGLYQLIPQINRLRR